MKNIIIRWKNVHVIYLRFNTPFRPPTNLRSINY